MVASDHQDGMAKGIGGGTDAEDVAELWASYKRNDRKGFEVVQDVKVFVRKEYYLVEIVGSVEKLVGSHTCHYVHVPIALKN